MHNIALGARYYPLSTACVIQPYAALMTYTNVGQSNDRNTMSSTGGGYSYERRYEISSPRVSVAPTVGLDCYIFYMALGIYDPDDDPKPETKKERRKSSLNKVLNSY